jgi:O-acetyl-ADP-ribose deacetylase (regulator of RNase III)
MIRYVEGDATKPIERSCVLAHICNDAGRWGRGFVVPLGRAYPEAREAYLGLPVRTLGTVQFVPSSSGVVVANMIAQHGVGTRRGAPPIRYEPLADCLEQVGAYARAHGLSVHMPRIGTGLAGGDWSLIEPLLRTHLCERHGVAVVVYDQPEPSRTR